MSANHNGSTTFQVLISKPGNLLATILLALFVLISGEVVFNQDNFAQAQVNEIDKVREEIEGVKTTFAIVNRLFSAAEMDDEALVGSRTKYQAIIDRAENTIKTIDDQSKAIADRLTEIGPAPEDPAVIEAKTVTETRAQLNQNKTTLAVAKTELEQIIAAAKDASGNITKIRQNAFTEAISKRTEITSGLFKEAANGLSSLGASTLSSFSTWFAYIKTNKFFAALASTFMSLASALILSVLTNRFFGTYLERKTREPDYFTRVFVGLWSVILPSLAVSIFLFATYTLFSQFNIFNENIAQIAFSAFMLIFALVFGWNLCRAIFAPNSYEWRLISLSNSDAKTMFWLTFTLFGIYMFDALFTTVNSVLSGPLALTVVQGIITAILIGAILIWMAKIIFRRRHFLEDAETHPKRFRWDSLIALGLGISAITIILAAVLGYIGFARFLAQQIVVTGAIVVTMFFAIVASRELAREGVLASTGFGRAMLQRGYDPLKVEQVALIGGLLLIAATLFIGIPAILLQWGTRFEEITAFGSAALTGFDIGGFRLSLSGVLIGLITFGIILLLTRLLQGWLTRSVFPRSKIDQGVSDSIRAGIGYVGFAIAGLMAVTSAGLDLSSLAIVAGALSLGIGFGLQNIVSNFVSGLILLVERPIKVGDWIVVGAAEGTVKRISVRATEIETFQKQSIIVPNSELINSQVGNWTFKSKAGRVDVPVGIAYGSDPRVAERILYEIAHNHAMVAKKPEPSVWFSGFGDSSLDFRLRMFLYDIANLVTVETEVRFEILKRFEEAGLEIPFPQRDVNLKLMSDSEKEAMASMAKKPAAKPRKTTKTAGKRPPRKVAPG